MRSAPSLVPTAAPLRMGNSKQQHFLDGPCPKYSQRKVCAFRVRLCELLKSPPFSGTRPHSEGFVMRKEAELTKATEKPCLKLSAQAKSEITICRFKCCIPYVTRSSSRCDAACDEAPGEGREAQRVRQKEAAFCAVELDALPKF